MIATVLLGIICTVLGAWRPLSVLMSPMMLLRVGMAAAASTFIAVGLRYMPLPTLTTVLQVTPLAVTAGAALLYGERVGWQRWLAVLAGFSGVVLIVKPGGAFGAAAYIALIALFCTTVRDLTTRGLDRSIPSLFVATASTGAIGLGGPGVCFRRWTLDHAERPGLDLSALFGGFPGGGECVRDHRAADREIAVIAPFRYVPVPLSLWFGWLWWGDVLDGFALAGIGLIVAAGLYTLHRERASLRKVLAPAPNRSPTG